MDSSKMREEFEAWYSDTLKKQEADMPKYCVSTLRFSKEVLWEGWKARQESLVIDFSELNVQHASYNNVDCYAISDVGAIIRKAGLKVKP